MKDILEPYLYYTSKELKDNISFPENDGGLGIRMKIINGLSYPVYVHSAMPVVKIEKTQNVINNELTILVEYTRPNLKKDNRLFVIREVELDKNMIYIKELNFLICKLENYTSDNTDTGFLTREITDISKYIKHALEYRVDNFGDPKILFNFNDPSKVHSHVFVSIFGEICEIAIDNNPQEKAIGEILVGYENPKKITIDIDELFSKGYSRFISEDVEILITLTKEKLQKELLSQKLHKNKMFSYEAVENEKDLIRDEHNRENAILKKQLEAEKQKSALALQSKEIEIDNLNIEIKKLKQEVERGEMEITRLCSSIDIDIKNKKISSDIKKLDSAEKVAELRVKKEKSTENTAFIVNAAKIAAVVLPIVVSAWAVYNTTTKGKEKEEISSVNGLMNMSTKSVARSLLMPKLLGSFTRYHIG